MGRHRVLEVLRLHVLERPDLDHAGVVHQDVDARRTLEDLGDRRVDVAPSTGCRRCMSSHRRVAAAPRPEPPRALELVLVARQQAHARALRGELPRQHQAEAARAAGDHDDAAGQVDRDGGCAQAGSRQERAAAPATIPTTNAADSSSRSPSGVAARSASTRRVATDVVVEIRVYVAAPVAAARSATPPRAPAGSSSSPPAYAAGGTVKSDVHERRHAPRVRGRAAHVVQAQRHAVRSQQRRAPRRHTTTDRGTRSRAARRAAGRRGSARSRSTSVPPTGRQLVEHRAEVPLQLARRDRRSRSSGSSGSFSFFMCVRNRLALTAYRKPGGARSRPARRTCCASGRR